ncbi:hypothetical protein Tco_1145023 [Tanacetum coccineum]
MRSEGTTYGLKPEASQHHNTIIHDMPTSAGPMVSNAKHKLHAWALSSFMVERKHAHVQLSSDAGILKVTLTESGPRNILYLSVSDIEARLDSLAAKATPSYVEWFLGKVLHVKRGYYREIGYLNYSRSSSEPSMCQHGSSKKTSHVPARFRRRPTVKDVGLRVADSHTGNHPEDDFTPLETIQRLCSIFWGKISFGLRRGDLRGEWEGMSTKNTLAIQLCEFSRKELDEFLSFYAIPSEYHVILSTSTQTILDAPLGYIGLYTRCFSLANLRLPLNDFFCEAYDCEPFVELFCGFFNLCKVGSWLTFQKRPEKHILSLLAKVITRIKGRHQRFFFIQYTIIPSKFPQLLLKGNMLDVKSFKDKLPSSIEQNPQFQRLGRYPVSARAFDDPIFFLVGLQSSWEHSQQRPAIFMGGKEMSFRNFIYTEEDEDLTFLPKDFSPGFNTGSPSMSINTEPVRTNEEPTVKPATEPATEPVNDVAAHIRERKCKTRGGSSRPPVKRKLASGTLTYRTVRARASTMKDDTPMLSISNDDEGLEDCLELKDATACHLKISAVTPPAWKGFLDNHLDVDLLDLHDRCYARQAVVDNAVNRRSHEILEVTEKLRGEADVMRARELAREEECKGLRAKCEAPMTDFDKNPTVLLLREKMSSLAAEEKEHKRNLDRLMLESQKWSGYQVSLLALESKVTSLEAEKANLEATKASLRQEIEKVKHDKREVVPKVVPYACMELLHSDELGRLVGKLVSSAITFGKLKSIILLDASGSVKALLSKNPPTLQKPIPSRTQMPVPFSQLATPSSAPSSNPMSPPADIVKPSHSQMNEGCHVDVNLAPRVVCTL